MCGPYLSIACEQLEKQHWRCLFVKDVPSWSLWVWRFPTRSCHNYATRDYARSYMKQCCDGTNVYMLWIILGVGTLTRHSGNSFRKSTSKSTSCFSLTCWFMFVRKRGNNLQQSLQETHTHRDSCVGDINMLHTFFVKFDALCCWYRCPPPVLNWTFTHEQRKQHSRFPTISLELATLHGRLWPWVADLRWRGGILGTNRFIEAGTYEILYEHPINHISPSLSSPVWRWRCFFLWWCFWHRSFPTVQIDILFKLLLF